MNGISRSEESAEKLEENLCSMRKKPEMARAKRPDTVLKPEHPEEAASEQPGLTKKEQALEFIKKTVDEAKSGISIADAFKAILKSGKLFFFSIGVILIMLLVSIFIYHQISSFVTIRTLDFFEIAPAADNLFSQIYHALKVCGAFLFKIVVGILLFYLSFVVSYALVSPLYSFISIIAEDVYFGKPKDDAELSIPGVIEDVKQALKISAVVFALGILAFFIGFIPVFGQIAAFVLCFFMNAFMIFDFVTSRRRWSLVQKAKWIVVNPAVTVKTALLPSVVSCIPVVNTILTAFMFPLFVVHATMNFAFEEAKKSAGTSGEKVEG
ncbi:EI24 domain-containing protein [bacterium]|nr:EI24 domain-containing protein [bacterium]